VRDEVARGRMIIPQHQHPELEPMAIGSRRCADHANIEFGGTSNVDEELKKLHTACTMLTR